MGIMYMGIYSDRIGDHEGYAAQLLPDGTETSMVLDLSEITGHRAACECGWRGATVHPPTEAGEQQADDEWEARHLEPLVDTEAARHTVTGAVLVRFMRELARQADRRPRVDGDRYDGHALGLCDANNQLGDLLDELTRQEVTA
ncbi:hypothetical protein CLV30_13142 [Haloactinopolyspora alba]|uniref:Uncharacterized protein n=1 Tax=Haloactinopolyspora alba TaxID=648780 RepID=A0A2P8D704_9ACTN|nr:hypothetical protein [Haloactinopolyspora alba]PSK93015.1 hypothetical protein CLV30_13142 [Haloactinopolyspora alba]